MPQFAQSMNDTAQPAMSTDRDEQVMKIRQCLAEALAVDVKTVTLDSCLMDDLGADSLAFLDIVFRLERAFDIQITRGEIERTARGDMSEDEFAPRGVLSDAGLKRLREIMPEAAAKVTEGFKVSQILGLFTTQTFLNMVQKKLANKAAGVSI